MTSIDPDLERRVRDHLQPGEQLRATAWASRADSRSAVGMTRAEMSPFRFRRPVTGETKGVDGAKGTFAAGLSEHIRNVTEPRVLVRTDRRLLLLSKGGSWRDRLRPSAGAPLRVRWECAAGDLASAAGQDGRLRLTFSDRSGVTLLTPAAQLDPFVAACNG